MKKNPELAARLQKIYDYLDKNCLTMNDGWYGAMEQLNDIIYELNPPMFPDPIDDIEIRDVTYFPGYEPEVKPRSFDIVKWEQHAPCEVMSLRTGEKEIVTRSCYSIATLEWDDKERGFNFNGVGLRWLEAAPSKAVCDMIVDFCNKKTKEYNQEDGYEK